MRWKMYIYISLYLDNLFQINTDCTFGGSLWCTSLLFFWDKQTGVSYRLQFYLKKGNLKCVGDMSFSNQRKNIYYLLHKENKFSYFYLICFAFVTLMLKIFIAITVITALQFILLKTKKVILFINTIYYYLFIYYMIIQFSKYNHNV